MLNEIILTFHKWLKWLIIFQFGSDLHWVGLQIAFRNLIKPAWYFASSALLGLFGLLDCWPPFKKVTVRFFILYVCFPLQHFEVIIFMVGIEVIVTCFIWFLSLELQFYFTILVVFSLAFGTSVDVLLLVLGQQQAFNVEFLVALFGSFSARFCLLNLHRRYVLLFLFNIAAYDHL